MNAHITNLDELCEAMNNGTVEGCWSDLPTFGGEEPEDTYCIWSWDAERMIIGDGDRYLIVPRGGEFDEEEEFHGLHPLHDGTADFDNAAEYYGLN